MRDENQQLQLLYERVVKINRNPVTGYNNNTHTNATVDSHLSLWDGGNPYAGHKKDAPVPQSGVGPIEGEETLAPNLNELASHAEACLEIARELRNSELIDHLFSILEMLRGE